MTKVVLNDISRWTVLWQKEIQTAIDRVLSRGWFILGPEVKAFEEEFADYCGVPYCVGVANGTDALEIAIRALGDGDEVITAANAGMYAASAIAAAGARPVFVDVGQDMTIDPEAVSRAVSPATRAVVATHLYGKLADMKALNAHLVPLGIPIIEDCAQAHGALRDGQRAGSFGTIGCFSFYPTKNLGALGDGGALTTQDSGLAQKVQALRQYGWTKRYEAEFIGGRNSRLDEIQAAILRFRLKQLDAGNDRRRAIMTTYHQVLGTAAKAVFPVEIGSDHVAHLCVAVVEDREAIRQGFSAAEIDTAIHYPIPDHKQAAMVPYINHPLILPKVESLAERIITLPCYPEMHQAEIMHVATQLKQAMEKEHVR